MMRPTFLPFALPDTDEAESAEVADGIGLAPPLARRVEPLSWLLAYGLERLKIFNIIPFGDTHYLVAIKMKDEG